MCELFSLRDGESLKFGGEQPSSGTWFAVMAVPVPSPPGERSLKRVFPGLPDADVTDLAIIACEKRRSDGKFLWMQLSPFAKEFIGDFLVENNAPHNVWIYVTVVAN